MRHFARLMLGAMLVAGCDSSIKPPFLNYQDCVKKTTQQSIAKGDPAIKAGLDAREYCRKQYHR